MTLHYGSLYWPSTWPDAPRYPRLTGDTACDVLIVGGGLTGALCGLTFARSGMDAVLIEQGAIAAGSTAASTGLIQYTNDIMLSELAGRIGEADAVLFYRACKEAIEHLALVAGSLPRDTGFSRRSSFYFASTAADIGALQQEYAMLERHGFGAEWWDADRVTARFPFRKEAVIVTHGDAEMNPYRFTAALVEAAAGEGLRAYERTPMLAIERDGAGGSGKGEGGDGGYAVRCADGVIRARSVVLSVGYAPEEAGSGRVQARLHRSYAIATKPLDSLAGWDQRMMIWETARPYLYMRTTADGRILAGGLDEPMRQPVLSEAELRRHSLRLLAEVHRLFPELRPEVAYEWCATFGESADDLPWIGEDPDRPGVFLALGYGGNGSVYSAVAAQLIRDRLAGRTHPLERIVGLARVPRPAPASR